MGFEPLAPDPNAYTKQPQERNNIKRELKMSNTEYIPNDEQLWDSLLTNQIEKNTTTIKNQGDTRNETPLLERFQISSTGVLPGLDLDPDSGILKFDVQTESHCALNFFGPVLFWMREYCTRPQPKTVMHLHSKDHDPFACVYLTRVISLLENLQDKGNHIELHWHFPATDLTSVLAVKQYRKNCPLPLMLHRKPSF